MPTRRQFVFQAGTVAALFKPIAWAAFTASAPQTAKPAAVTDEMTVNSAPHPQDIYPPPEFGLPPAQLPPETLALRDTASLRFAAGQHGLVVGTAVIPGLLARDPALAALVADQYGVLVPEGALKWRALRPSADRYDFAVSDELFDFAAAHGLQVRGHTLAWHNSVPDWFQVLPPGTDVRKLFVEHIRTVVGRYRGRVQSWDVVNEAILPADKEPGNLRKSYWYDAVGPDYIDLAFRAAREVDPHAKLTYNDYGVEMDSPEDAARREAILALLRGMQQRGIPLDAVGIQCHIKAASAFTVGKGLHDYLRAIEQMGLEVYLTEMDVNEDDIASNEEAVRDRLVAQTYRDFLAVALMSPAVKQVLTWGVSDRRTWLNDGPTHHRKQPNRPQRSLLFDAQYRPTPAFFAVRESFQQRRTTSSPAHP